MKFRFLFIIVLKMQYPYSFIFKVINKTFKNIYPSGDACQKTKLKPEKRPSVTSLMCAAVVCLLIISVICFTSYVYMYIRFIMKQYVDLPQAL